MHFHVFAWLCHCSTRITPSWHMSRSFASYPGTLHPPPPDVTPQALSEWLASFSRVIFITRHKPRKMLMYQGSATVRADTSDHLLGLGGGGIYECDGLEGVCDGLLPLDYNGWKQGDYLPLNYLNTIHFSSDIHRGWLAYLHIYEKAAPVWVK